MKYQKVSDKSFWWSTIKGLAIPVQIKQVTMYQLWIRKRIMYSPWATYVYLILSVLPLFCVLNKLKQII